MKAEILRSLAKADGYVSGEQISREVGKSRTAVWQWIEELRADGYEIEAVTRRGYRLLARPDRLYPWEIERHLQTEVIGRTIEYHERIGSTNDEAKARAKDGADEGLVIVAEEQVSGRGRRGRSWASPFGLGIWSSALLRPPISPYEAPKAALLAALATARAIRDIAGVEAGIKWPNDVLIGGKKTAGILVEMDAEIAYVRSLIIGIGINANLPLEAIPREVRHSATSLMIAGGKAVDRARLFADALGHLERLYIQWKASGFGSILESVRRHTVTLGREVSVVEGDRTWVAEAVDLADDGALLVRDERGRLRPVYAAEVSIREGPQG